MSPVGQSGVDTLPAPPVSDESSSTVFAAPLSLHNATPPDVAQLAHITFQTQYELRPTPPRNPTFDAKTKQPSARRP